MLLLNLNPKKWAIWALLNWFSYLSSPFLLLLVSPKHIYLFMVPKPYLIITAKVAACNHVCYDHLNLALGCLNCSFENNHKMCWYSISAWEHYTVKHLKDNLPIFQTIPIFLSKSCPVLMVMLFPIL